MRPGARVTVPDRLNWSGGAREEATLVRSMKLPGPPVMQGSPLAPIVLHRVRFDDGTEENYPDGSVFPI